MSVEDFLFEVVTAPVEAVVGQNGGTRRIAVPGKKALLNAATGGVLGVVSRSYRVVTNREAVELALKVCERAFPGISPVEWQPERAVGPRTMSHAFIDLMHRTHVLNYWDSRARADDPYTPFLRVTNSFNGARALRFDIGFMRKHCSNGVIFEQEVATIRAAHDAEALEQLQVEIKTRSLPQMWEEFSRFISSIRSVAMDRGQSMTALQTVLRFAPPRDNDPPARRADLAALGDDFSTRLDGYRTHLGPNAYAVFHTLTDIAARPPVNRHFWKDRDTIEKRAGRWLKELGRQSGEPGFKLDAWISQWEPGQSAQFR